MRSANAVAERSANPRRYPARKPLTHMTKSIREFDEIYTMIFKPAVDPQLHFREKRGATDAVLSVGFGHLTFSRGDVGRRAFGSRGVVNRIERTIDERRLDSSLSQCPSRD